MHYTNHLKHETSPYLLQHAANPVDWYPWNQDALDRARSENKPVLLSIGYSACHWCHVMAHESFEDPATAAVMNELFVNIKVDREERPDLDKIYQTAHQLLTQRSGGWPLTMFLTADKQIPFFGGTYFPNQSRHGLPAFSELCRRVAAFYHDKQHEIERQNQSLVDFMSSMDAVEPNQGTLLTAAPLDAARQQLEQQFDSQHGGFGKAPKFPHPTSLERLLRHWSASRTDCQEDTRALHMALFTLERMALGGMYDQIGGGFCRYSVDEQWMIPHFEKMLYDNGPLLSLYAEACAITGRKLFQRIVEETAAWAEREMQSPQGAFYSSLDADSEGVEGRFYAWEREQIQSILSDDEYTVAAKRFGFERSANFEGKWHPHVFHSIDEIATAPGLDTDQVEQLLSDARQKLFTAREQRIHPHRDDKILVSWNALMIKGLAQASRHLSQPTYAQLAESALDYIHQQMWKNGRLLATSKDGRSHLNAYLDDYVFLIDAILELLQVRWRSADLDFAIQLIEVVLDHFADNRGGFYFTADDHEKLIQRPRPLSDDALPAGNAIAAKVLGRLGHLLGETRYLDAAEQSLKAAFQTIQQAPYAHTGLLLALEEQLNPVQIIVIRGSVREAGAWLQLAGRSYTPQRLCFLIPDSVRNLAGLLAEHRPENGVIAYICEGTRCLPPVTSFDNFRQQLS